MILVERGVAPRDAIMRVRAARPHAIETRAQENHVLAAGDSMVSSNNINEECGATKLLGLPVNFGLCLNVSAIRKFALSALRNDKQYPERSLRRRRKLADRRPEYRAQLLGLELQP